MKSRCTKIKKQNAKFVKGLNSKSFDRPLAKQILCELTKPVTSIFAKRCPQNAMAHGSDPGDAWDTHLLDGDLQQLGISGHDVWFSSEVNAFRARATATPWRLSPLQRAGRADFLNVDNYNEQKAPADISRCGPMDKAPAYGAGDSRFESVQWYLFASFFFAKICIQRFPDYLLTCLPDYTLKDIYASSERVVCLYTQSSIHANKKN